MAKTVQKVYACHCLQENYKDIVGNWHGVNPQLTAIASKQEDLKKDKDKLATLDRQIQSLTEDAKHQCADIKPQEQNLLQDKGRLQHERERLISRSHQLNET